MEEKSTPDFRLIEPVSPESLVPAIDFTPWIIGAALLLVIALLLVFLLRRRKRALAEDPKARRRAALEEACRAFEKISAANAREAAVATSLILRKFLSVAVNDPALFETHEEFISRRDALAALQSGAREACSTGFSRLARLKYAPEVPNVEPGQVISESRELLQTLDQGLAA